MTPERLARLSALRHALHQIPEVSGAEEKTASFIADHLQQYQPDQILTGLGGYGVAAVFRSAAPGPTVMIRCELDGLPIEEQSDLAYRSTHTGRGHLCGHDGHMTMVVALAEEFHANRPATGCVILLFQPAEETGKGAPAVIADPAFARLAPDYVFSLHNLPGLAVGQVAISEGAANCASRGLRIKLTGKTSHAAAPQEGISPAGVISQLLPQLADLAEGEDLDNSFAAVTVTHAQLGEPTFGIAPGYGEVWATLRTVTDARMAQLIEDASARVRTLCQAAGLAFEVEFDDMFEACTNDAEAAARLRNASAAVGFPMAQLTKPQRWSEDFGQFSKQAKAAMFWLGSGLDQPQLHNPDYDFPDASIPVGVAIFSRVIRDFVG